MILNHLSLLEGSATREAAPRLHRGQKVCPTRAISVTLKNQYSLDRRMWARSLEEITASDSTLNNRAAKRLGLSQRQIREPAPLFKRLGGRFAPKNRLFSSRVEKVGLTCSGFLGGAMGFVW
jgi:hypothetical protein